MKPTEKAVIATAIAWREASDGFFDPVRESECLAEAVDAYLAVDSVPAKPTKAMPTEPGYWYVKGSPHPVRVRWYDSSVGCAPQECTKLCIDWGGGEPYSVESATARDIEWVRRIPTVDELAALDAEVVSLREQLARARPTAEVVEWL